MPLTRVVIDQNNFFLFFCFEYKILASFTNETNSF